MCVAMTKDVLLFAFLSRLVSASVPVPVPLAATIPGGGDGDGGDACVVRVCLGGEGRCTGACA